VRAQAKNATLASPRREAPASIDDVAALVGVRKDSMGHSIESRGLPATKVGLWTPKLSELDAWMRAQREADDRGSRAATRRRAGGILLKKPLCLDPLAGAIAEVLGSGRKAAP
jgi:hypothetical protein